MDIQNSPFAKFNMPKIYQPDLYNTQVKNDLQRSPVKDSFEKSTPNANQKTKTITAITGAVALASTIGVGLLSKNQKVLKNALEVAKDQIATQSDTITKQQEEIREALENLTKSKKIAQGLSQELQEEQAKLKKLLEEFISTPAGSIKRKEEFIQEYTELFETRPFQYTTEGITRKLETPLGHIGAKLRGVGEIEPLKALPNFIEQTDTTDLSKLFRETGTLDFTVPRYARVNPTISDKAYIGSKRISNLGQPTNTDFKLAYGQRVDWSEEKIARDIMQNFYDGHGNTLDGVRIFMEKTPTGSTRIKISGEALFDYENLQYLGSGKKIENPYNAGGFGEGSKILVANMIGKGDTQAVKFGCADWELVFDSADGIMRRTLTKTETPLEGNFIEFETTNEKLVNSVINSINYFRHSTNPDFADLAYDSRDFGFRFMPKGKGNIYLTQRFEFDGNGGWDGSVNGINLVFNRKPDPKKFKEITGEALFADRDRTFLTNKDIENFTRYFAHDMSDDDLLRTAISSRPLWEDIEFEKTESQVSAFLKGIFAELKARKLAIDFGEERIAYIEHENDTVRNKLRKYGYRLLPKYFKDLGVNSGSNTFKNLSQHVALEANPVEMKKMQILEEAVRVIKEDLDASLATMLQKPLIEIDPKKVSNKYGIKELLDLFQDAPEFQNLGYKHLSYYNKTEFIERLSDEAKEDIIVKLNKLMNERFIALASAENKNEVTGLIGKLEHYGISCALSDKTQEYLRTIKNLRLIEDSDITKPRYIFDRWSEISTNTAGEAIIKGRQYKGHWVDRTYLRDAYFNEALATWIHEICHKSGGDGSAEFTYALTDILGAMVKPNQNSTSKIKLAALEEMYEKLA